MIEYIYFVKCPDCEDEHFNFFDEAKEYALGCLGNKPIITQTEVCRNDFGECTDHSDLGTIWSWEDMMTDVSADEPAVSVFTHGDFAEYNPDHDEEFDSLDNSLDFEPVTSEVSAIDDLPDNFCNPIKSKQDKLAESSVNKFVIVGEKEDYSKQFYNTESGEWVAKSDDATLFDDRNSAIEVLYDLDKSDFYTTRVMIKPVSANEGISDDFRKSIPEGMTIEQLVEEMEENEDIVEGKWCEELFDKSECRYEVDLGWLCSRCEAAIKSRGETLTFRENSYWDFLDEDCSVKESFDPNDTVEFEYDRLNVTLFSSHFSSEYGHYSDEHDVVLYDYVYEVSKEDVANDLWENGFITEEDATDVPGGLEALEYDPEWSNFLDAHFDEVLEKYYDKLLVYYKEKAAEEAAERSSYEDYEKERYDDYLASQEDDRYDESLSTTKSMLEELEESEDYTKRLTLCPECGAEKFDKDTGICINCGFEVEN